MTSQFSDATIKGLPLMFNRHVDIFHDPVSHGPVAEIGGELIAVETGHRFETNDGIPNFYIEVDPATGAHVNDISDRVRSFYEETPFPHYDELDSRHSLQEKAQMGVFAKLLEQQIPEGALVWEAGCGTGQLSNFLGMSWKRQVFGGDLCLNSLKLAKGFADRNVIRNVSFAQMNLFQAPFKDAVFDVVISNGVLHHTADCEGAFRAILSKLKPGGHILVGLYNRYARLPTLWKRAGFGMFGRSLYFLDHRLKDFETNPDRVKAWFGDQYQHPHETRHSMDEVLGWFGRYGVAFVNGIPHVDGSEFASDERLFEPRSAGHAVGRIATQMEMLLSGGKDGGLFIMIGKKL